MEAAKEEIRRIKEEEEQAMREALGLAPKRSTRPQGNRLDKHEFSELVKRGSTAEDLGAGHAEAAQVQGVGFSRYNLFQVENNYYECQLDKSYLQLLLIFWLILIDFFKSVFIFLTMISFIF